MKRLALAFGIAALAACDPGWHVEGTVVDATGAPIASASVVLACPKGAPETHVTGADGKFSWGGIGGQTTDKCTLAISKAGFAPKSVVATDACYRSSSKHNLSDHCAPTDGRITLTAAP